MPWEQNSQYTPPSASVQAMACARLGDDGSNLPAIARVIDAGHCAPDATKGELQAATAAAEVAAEELPPAAAPAADAAPPQPVNEAMVPQCEHEQV